MKKILLYISMTFFVATAFAQDDVYPTPEYKGVFFIRNATIHVGNGQVISNGIIKVNNGKIEQVGAAVPIPVDNVKVYDAKGKNVYPGLILSATQLGIREIGGNAVRGSNDLPNWEITILISARSWPTMRTQRSLAHCAPMEFYWPM